MQSGLAWMRWRSSMWTQVHNAHPLVGSADVKNVGCSSVPGSSIVRTGMANPTAELLPGSCSWSAQSRFSRAWYAGQAGSCRWVASVPNMRASSRTSGSPDSREDCLAQIEPNGADKLRRDDRA